MSTADAIGTITTVVLLLGLLAVAAWVLHAWVQDEERYGRIEAARRTGNNRKIIAAIDAHQAELRQGEEASRRRRAVAAGVTYGLAYPLLCLWRGTLGALVSR